MSTTELEDNIVTEQIPIIQITENGIEGFEILCRLCANRSEHLIPIYGEEGTSNDLSDKMNLYLPVKVTADDTLPLQCCFQCASTVLSWHELVIASVEADKRLRDLQEEAEKHLEQQKVAMQQAALEDKKYYIKSESDDDRPIITTEECLNPVRQEDINKTVPSPKKRGRRPKNQTTQRNETVLIREINDDHPSTHEEWIKSELMLTAIDTEQDNYEEVDCSLKDEVEKIELAQNRESEESDFDNLDPDYNSGEYSNSTHDCQNCEAKFDSLKGLRIHLKLCGLEKELKEEDIDDLGKKKTKTIGLRKKYHCNYCPVNATSTELKRHMLENHPDKIDHFVDTKKKRKHSKIDQEAVNKAKVVVDSRTYYHCNECGKNLHSPYTYIWHNRIHTGERPFVCDLCGKQFRVSQGLVRHLRETHAGIKNFPCDLCGRMFATRRNVEEHRRIHTNERPYICDLCGKSFKQKASLFVHNRSHNDTFPFRCSYCNQGFRTRPPLLVHVTRHTGEKPYACDICGRCFRIKYELKRHRLIHSDDKPFSCTECGLSFRQKRYLRNHNKINHNRPTP